MGRVGIVSSSPQDWIKKLERRNIVLDPLHMELIGYDDDDEEQEEGSEQEENDMENVPGEVEEEETPEEEQEEEYNPYEDMTFAPGSGPPDIADSGYNYPYPPAIALPPTLFSTPPVFPPSPPFEQTPPSQLTAMANVVAQSAVNFQNKVAEGNPSALKSLANLVNSAKTNPTSYQTLKVLSKPFSSSPPQFQTSAPAQSKPGGIFSSLTSAVKPPPPKPSVKTNPFSTLSSLTSKPITPPPAQTTAQVKTNPYSGLSKLGFKGEPMVAGGQVTSAVSNIIKIALSPVVWATHGTGTVAKEVGNVLETIARKL